MNEATQTFPIPAAPSAPDRWRPGITISFWLLVLITLVAALLRLHGIASKSFWLDEGISVEIARLPWRQFFYVLRHREVNMSLYYVLLHFWLAMGSTEGFIRGLSVLFSVATVPALYALGARLFGRVAGLLAAWLLVRNLQEPASAHWAAYTVACALAVYSHFFGALVVLAHGVSLAFLRRGDLPWMRLARSVRWFAYLMIPIAMIVATVGAGSMRWIPPVKMSAVLEFFIRLAGNGGVPLLTLDVIAAALAVFAAWREWRNEGLTMNGWEYALVFAWLVVPIAAVLAVSVVRPVFLARYLIPCLPALVLLVATGITQPRARALAWIFVAAISVFSILGDTSYYRRDFDLDREDWRAATSYVLDRAQPEDGAFFYANFGRLPFDFYRSQRHPSPRWPDALVAANGKDWGYRDSLFAYLGEALQDAQPAGDRVWLVLSFNNSSNGEPNRETAMLRAVYGKGRRLMEEKRISRITILLYARDSTASAQTSGEKSRSE